MSSATGGIVAEDNIHFYQATHFPLDLMCIDTTVFSQLQGTDGMRLVSPLA